MTKQNTYRPLPLVEHQPVIITANIATERGLDSGTMARIVAVIQHPDDDDIDVSAGHRLI